ncbi:unnamed protein product, partial [Ectocarpus sp. 12 AP-2014]
SELDCSAEEGRVLMPKMAALERKHATLRITELVCPRVLLHVVYLDVWRTRFIVLFLKRTRNGRFRCLPSGHLCPDTTAGNVKKSTRRMNVDQTAVYNSVACWNLRQQLHQLTEEHVPHGDCARR